MPLRCDRFRQCDRAARDLCTVSYTHLDVYKRQVLNRLRTQAGPRRRFWARIMALGLTVGATVLFSVIAVVSLVADHWLIGTQWQDLGEVIALLAAFYIGIAVLGPLQEVATLSRQPFWQVAINACLLYTSRCV